MFLMSMMNTRIPITPQLLVLFAFPAERSMAKARHGSPGNQHDRPVERHTNQQVQRRRRRLR
jgi:hypothetical protein